MADDVGVESQAIQAAAAASAATYNSFADATSSVLDLLERHLPEAAPYLAHLDRGQDVHRIVDARGGADFGLRSNLAVPLSESFDAHMADERGPRRCGDLAAHPLYGRIEAKRRSGAASYLGVPVELSDGSRVGVLAVLSRAFDAFSEEDERLLAMLARVLAYELERETNERDLRRLNDSLRGQARGMAALGRVARALSGGDEDARRAICQATCEAALAPIAFLLEPSGRDFASSAMVGVEMAPVTIQARSDATPTGPGRSLMGTESYFVADAQTHPALAAPLVEATRARSALFEPVLRDGNVAGVLMVIWQSPVGRLDDATASVLHLLASQAAVAIGQSGLRAKVESLALTDPLTGLGTRRSFEEELPRELARARRNEMALCVAALDLDHMGAFNMLRGEREGDRLIKETAATWAGTLRAVDLAARLDGDEFAVLLPGCALGEAIEVVDRLRELTPRGQSSSAGVARWDGDEPAEILLLRARDALGAAKASGRGTTFAAE
jgi:diguanylate cyclase (GGDEF)-like protein